MVMMTYSGVYHLFSSSRLVKQEHGECWRAKQKLVVGAKARGGSAAPGGIPPPPKKKKIESVVVVAVAYRREGVTDFLATTS